LYCLWVFSTLFVSSTHQSASPKAATTGTGPEPEWLKLVRAHVGELRFGVIQITVQDGRVVLIERTDKLRFDKPE
jgi:hypothetical protein